MNRHIILCPHRSHVADTKAKKYTVTPDQPVNKEAEAEDTKSIYSAASSEEDEDKGSLEYQVMSGQTWPYDLLVGDMTNLIYCSG